MDDACASRAAEVRVCLRSVRALDVSAQPAGGQPVASDSSTAAKLFACERVPRESMCIAGEARARVLRAWRARGGRVCAGARAEQARGRGGGEAQAGHAGVHSALLCDAL